MFGVNNIINTKTTPYVPENNSPYTQLLGTRSHNHKSHFYYIWFSLSLQLCCTTIQGSSGDSHSKIPGTLLQSIRLFFCIIQFSSFPQVILGPRPAILFSIQHLSKRNIHTTLAPEILQTPSMGKSHKTGHRCA